MPTSHSACSTNETKQIKAKAVECYWHCSNEIVRYKSSETVNFCCFRCATTSPTTVFYKLRFLHLLLVQLLNCKQKAFTTTAVVVGHNNKWYSPSTVLNTTSLKSYSVFCRIPGLWPASSQHIQSRHPGASNTVSNASVVVNISRIEPELHLLRTLNN